MNKNFLLKLQRFGSNTCRRQQCVRLYKTFLEESVYKDKKQIQTDTLTRNIWMKFVESVTK